MRILFAFISLATLITSLVFFWRVGGAELFAAVLLLVLSIHLEIGLRIQDAVRFMTGELNLIADLLRGENGTP